MNMDLFFKITGYLGVSLFVLIIIGQIFFDKIDIGKLGEGLNSFLIWFFKYLILISGVIITIGVISMPAFFLVFIEKNNLYSGAPKYIANLGIIYIFTFLLGIILFSFAKKNGGISYFNSPRYSRKILLNPVIVFISFLIPTIPSILFFDLIRRIFPIENVFFSILVYGLFTLIFVLIFMEVVKKGQLKNKIYGYFFREHYYWHKSWKLTDSGQLDKISNASILDQAIGNLTRSVEIYPTIIAHKYIAKVYARYFFNRK